MSLLSEQAQHLIALVKIQIEMSVVFKMAEGRREIEQDFRIMEPIVGVFPVLELLVISVD